jgi:hypothetical protein
VLYVVVAERTQMIRPVGGLAGGVILSRCESEHRVSGINNQAGQGGRVWLEGGGTVEGLAESTPLGHPPTRHVPTCTALSSDSSLPSSY